VPGQSICGRILASLGTEYEKWEMIKALGKTYLYPKILYFYFMMQLRFIFLLNIKFYRDTWEEGIS
jgi:hypothetical protein